MRIICFSAVFRVFLEYFRYFVSVIFKCILPDVYKRSFPFRKRAKEHRNSQEKEFSHGSESIDDLVEQMLLHQGDYYDPYEMDDRAIGFEKAISINISGEAQMFNGYVTGLRTLHRRENCAVKLEGERLRIRAVLGAGRFDSRYCIAAKFMNMGPSISVHGILHYIELTLEFTVDVNTGKNCVLEKFSADDMRGLIVEIAGLGLLNWPINQFMKAVIPVVRCFVRRLLERQLERYISKTLREYRFLVNADLITTSEVL